MTTEYLPFITGCFRSVLDMVYFFFATEKLKDGFHLIHVQFHGAFEHDCAWNSLRDFEYRLVWMLLTLHFVSINFFSPSLWMSWHYCVCCGLLLEITLEIGIRSTVII